MNWPISIRYSLTLWLVLLGILLLTNHHLLTVPIYEDRDGAANALQITNAKSFTEIYGNYSRWRFHHPGPFFFYLYAVGEILFHDLVPIFPAPHNAHVFMGIAIQLGFFITALHIAARYFRSPFFLPLALFSALIHFGLVDQMISGSVLISLWPPHVLLFPFLCFLVSCASLATGYSQHLPIAVFCGSALVHGHVAQPLFVLSLGLGSYFVFLWSIQKKPSDATTSLRSHAIALLIVVVFCLPILLDLFKGQESNFASILDHLSQNRSKKTWMQGLLYVVSFFSYFENQQILIIPDAVTILLERWPYYVIWAAILSYVVFSLCYRTEEPTIDRRFEISFAIVILAAFFLSIVWGQRQDGQMFNFNGYYIFSIPYAVLIIFAGRFASRCSLSLQPRLRFAMIAGILASFVIFSTGPAVENTRIMERVDLALQSDPAGHSPKLLAFDHDNWPQAIAMALALQRKQIPFYVSHDWGFMFGEKNVWKNREKSAGSIWSIAPQESKVKGVSFIGSTSITTRPFPRNIVVPVTIRFDQILPPDIVIDGFSRRMPKVIRTRGDRASIDFSRRFPEAFTLILQASTFEENESLPVQVKIGEITRQLNLTKYKNSYRLHFDRVGEATKLDLTILSDHSTDNRSSRGLKLFTITISAPEKD